MSIYLSRLFPRCNSSFPVCRGNALQAEVLRFRKDLFVVDAALGTPRICLQDETTVVPTNRATRFENKVGFEDVVARKSLMRHHMLERFFIDVVAGDSTMKDNAAARFIDSVGSIDAVPGEPHLLLPRKFRRRKAWMELNKIRRRNSQVKGFIIEKVRGGYSVAIAGYIAFLPIRPHLRNRMMNDRFTIESIDNKTMRFVVF